MTLREAKVLAKDLVARANMLLDDIDGAISVDDHRPEYLKLLELSAEGCAAQAVLIKNTIETWSARCEETKTRKK